MAAIAAPKHSESSLRFASPAQGNMTEQKLWAELYYRLPYGRCAAANCGCLRFRVHPNDFHPENHTFTENCHGCEHDHSFHALGSESDRAYGLRYRQDLYLLAEFVRNKDVADETLHVPMASVAVEPDPKDNPIQPQTIADIMEQMKANMRARQPDKIAPGSISPKSERSDQNAQLAATQEPTQHEAFTEQQQHSNYHSHQDSMQTVEPFDISPDPSRSPSLQPPVAHDAIEAQTQSRASSRTPPLSEMKKVLEHLGVDSGPEPSRDDTDRGWGEPMEAMPQSTTRQPAKQPAITSGTRAFGPDWQEAEDAQSWFPEHEQSVQATSTKVARSGHARSDAQAAANYSSSIEPAPKTSAISSIVPDDTWGENEGILYDSPEDLRARGLTADTHEGRAQLDREGRCHRCLMSGHRKKECPELHKRRDDPNLQHSNNALQQRDRLGPACPICRMRGHVAADCPGMERAQLMADDGSPTSQASLGLDSSRHAPAVPPTESVVQTSTKQDAAATASQDPSASSQRPAAPIAKEEPRGRSPTKSSQSSKLAALSLKQEPMVKIWADEQPKKAVPWWEEESAADNTGDVGATEAQSVEKSGIADWNTQDRGPGFIRDQQNNLARNPDTSWGGSWADEVEAEISRPVGRERRDGWGDPPVWKENSRARYGRGRGRGGMNDSSSRDVANQFAGFSGTRPLVPVPTAPAKHTQANREAVSPMAEGKSIGARGVDEDARGQGEEGAKSPAPSMNSMTGKSWKSSGHSGSSGWKSVTPIVPKGPWKKKTSREREEQRKRARCRKSKEALDATRAAQQDGNPYQDSQFRVHLPNVAKQKSNNTINNQKFNRRTSRARSETTEMSNLIEL